MSVNAELISAARSGDRRRVEELLAQGADPNSANEYGVAALWMAAIEQHAGVVQVLLAHHACPNPARDSGYSLLHELAFYEETEVMRLLLENGAEVDARGAAGYTPLARAALYGHVEIVKLLLQFGADPAATGDEGDSPIDVARREGHAAILALLEGKSQEAIPVGCDIFEAVSKGDTLTIRHLLDAGADPNARNSNGETLLDVAVTGYRVEAAELLLNAGADPDARTRDHTPLQLLVWAGHAGLVRLLLDHNATIEDGDDLLATAKRQMNTQVVEILREHLSR